MHSHAVLHSIYKAMMVGQNRGTLTEHNLLDCATHFWSIQYMWIMKQ